MASWSPESHEHHLEYQLLLTNSQNQRSLTFTRSSVSDRPDHVSVKALLAVVAVAACSVVAAVHADSSALPP